MYISDTALDEDEAAILFISLNYGEQRHFGVFPELKNIIDADFDDENVMTNAAPVPTPSKMRNFTKIMRSYLDTHSNEEMNDKTDDSLLKKSLQRKILDYFPKIQ
ncbi:uncharacterized protein TNCV_3541851 [Trichonephila clavipes]|nr:uncharacterized protein TNCV_3541851 [Trichonephila clavipes]